jgi:hypothetical protein
MIQSGRQSNEMEFVPCGRIRLVIAKIRLVTSAATGLN